MEKEGTGWKTSHSQEKRRDVESDKRNNRTSREIKKKPAPKGKPSAWNKKTGRSLLLKGKPGRWDHLGTQRKRGSTTEHDLGTGGGEGKNDRTSSWIKKKLPKKMAPAETRCKTFVLSRGA